AGGDATLSFLTVHDHGGVEGDQARGDVGGWVGVAGRAADGPLVADLGSAGDPPGDAAEPPVRTAAVRRLWWHRGWWWSSPAGLRRGRGSGGGRAGRRSAERPRMP